MNKLLTLIRQPFISLKYYSKHRDNNIWIFGEWFGTKACDNSLYLANYISNTNKNIKCYWVANEDADLHLLNKEIKIVNRDSKESKELFKKCGVVIMNQGFIDFSSSGNNYFNGAITINLWHGVPWKKINFDVLKHQLLFKPLLLIYKKMIMANYYLSSSNECANKFKSAFLTNNIIHCGQPRNTILFSDDFANKTKKEFLNEHNLPLDTKIITYMPTFRDSQKPNFFFTDNIDLKNIIVPNKYIIVQKNHFASKNKNCLNNDYIIGSLNYSAQELLSISDILITDYSSCFFDFLIKNKPIIHYIYDYEEYKNRDRGLYYSVDDVKCGNVCYTYEELLTSLQNIIFNNIDNPSLRKERYNKYIEYEKENNCAAVFNKIKEIINEN